MTYHKINNENNSTNIDQFVNQTEFNERMSVTNMVLIKQNLMKE